MCLLALLTHQIQDSSSFFEHLKITVCPLAAGTRSMLIPCNLTLSSFNQNSALSNSALLTHTIFCSGVKPLLLVQKVLVFLERLLFTASLSFRFFLELYKKISFLGEK